MDPRDILTAAEGTTSNNWVQQMDSGAMEAILTFGSAKAAGVVVAQLLAADVPFIKTERSAYGETILMVRWDGK